MWYEDAMPVGTKPLVFYEREDIAPRFKVVDPRVTDIFGWTIVFAVSVSADDITPLQSVVCAIVGSSPTLEFDAIMKLNSSLIPGKYKYGIRRTDAGNDWQLAQGDFEVLNSVNAP